MQVRSAPACHQCVSQVTEPLASTAAFIDEKKRQVGVSVT